VLTGWVRKRELPATLDAPDPVGFELRQLVEDARMELGDVLGAQGAM
jgi:hypothetical protein